MRYIIILLFLSVFSIADDTLESKVSQCEEYDNRATEYLGLMAVAEKMNDYDLLQRNGNTFLIVSKLSIDICKQVGLEEYEKVIIFKQHTIQFIKQYIADKYPNWDYKLGVNNETTITKGI